MGADDFFNKIDRAIDGYHRAKSEYSFLRGSYDFYNSPDRYLERKKAEKRDKISSILFCGVILIWIIVIIATIVLCVTGNDAILKILNL